MRIVTSPAPCDVSPPVEAILGFADVAALMVAAIWLVSRWRRRHVDPVPAAPAS